MLYEFALDPSVLNNWDSIRYFLEKFGVPRGRLISRYPSKWKKMVYYACSSCKDVEKKKIEESLITIDSKLMRSNREYDSKSDWLPNAIQQTNKLPFHAIISNKSSQDVQNILIAEDITEDTPLWDIKKEDCIPRKASFLGGCVNQLLKISSEIIFVDPYFDPSKSRFINTLSEFLNSTNENKKIKRIEFHLEDKLGKDFFGNECQKHVPGILSKGREITFIRWKQLEGRDDLHPRYILTERGGIRIERGLDEGDDGETTDVSLLDSSLHDRRWKDYQQDTSPFGFVDELKIIGSL